MPVIETTTESGSGSMTRAKKPPLWKREIAFLSSGKKQVKKFKQKELIQFFRGVGSMLKAQINTADAIKYYSHGLPNKKMGEALDQIREDIMNGISTHDAFRRSNCFNDMTVGLIRSGSDAGRLDQAFAALAARMKTDMTFKKQLKKVVMIPCIVIPVLFGAFVVAQVKIVPQVEDMLSQVKQEPDPLTKAAFGMSHFIQDFWPLIFAGAVGVILTLSFSKNAQTFVLNLMMSKWRLLKNLIMSLRQLTLLSTIRLLHSNGINLAKSIRVGATSVKGSALYDEVVEAADSYEHTGVALSTAFLTYTSVDEQVCHMMAIGEKSASIDDQLGLLSDMYKEDSENYMETFTQVVNAIVIITAVSLIAAVFISAFLPIFLMGPRLMQSGL